MAFENFLKRRGRNSSRQRYVPLTFDYSNILGVNYTDSIYTMPANISPYARNADFGKPVGSISKIKGFESLFASLGAGKMLGINGWQHSTGDKFIAAWDKNLYLITGESGSVSKSSQADWEAGTLLDLDTATSPGNMLCQALEGSDFQHSVTNTADFNGSHGSTVALGNAVVLGKETSAHVRLYLQNAAPDYVPEDESGTAIKLSNSKSGSIEYAQNRDLILVTDPIPASKTIQGTLSWCTGAWENNPAVNAYYSLNAYVSVGETGNKRGTLLTYNSTEFSGSVATCGKAVSNIALNSVNAQAGDRIVIVFRAHRRTPPEHTDSMRMYYGGTNTTDLTNAANGSIYPGWVQFSDDPFIHYYSSGTYTHGELDISNVGMVYSSNFIYNATIPDNTSVTVEISKSIDNGDTWGPWKVYDSGDELFLPGNVLDNHRLKWRAILSTSDNRITPELNDLSISITRSAFDKQGIWTSPVYDLGYTPNSGNLTWYQSLPEDTYTVWYARGSSNGSVFGDWNEVRISGDLIPCTRYIQLKVVLNASQTQTPEVNSFTINYTSGYTVPNKLNLSTLGRVDNKLTGNRVCFRNYQDWLLVTDGLRPFIAYITTSTQTTGTAQAGGANTITLAAGASAVTDFYNNAFITITSGTGAGQVRWISGYNGSTKAATLSKNWTVQPNSTSVYSIGSAIKFRNAGIDPPTTALTAAASTTSGSPNGTYLYKVTYVNVDGIESNPGPASASVSATSKQINLTNIPVDASLGNTTVKRRVYRTAAGASVYKFLTEIADNTTATYTDNTSDTALGSLMLDNNNIPPTACSLIFEFNSYVFYVDGYDVWFSKAGSPDQVPNISGDIQVFSMPGPVLDIKNHPTALIITGEDFIATITSNSGFIFDSDPTVDTTIMKVIDNNGGLSHEASAMCLSPNLRSTLVLNTHTGLKATVPGIQDQSLESIPLSKNIQPFYELSVNRDMAAGVFYDSYYWYSLEYMAEDAAAVEYLTFAYDLRTEQWYGPWEFGMACYTVINNVLYAGDKDKGKIYRMGVGNTFDGEPIKMVVDMPMRAPGGEAGTCKFKNILAVVSNESNTALTIVKPKVDEREASISLGALSSAFSGNVRPGHDFVRTQKHRIPLPRGHTYSVRIEDNSVNPVEINKIITEYEVLPLSQ